MKLKNRRHRNNKPIGDPYDIMRVKLDGEPYTVYLCRNCMRGWKLPEPVENWRIKSLLTHSATHRVDKEIGRILDAPATSQEGQHFDLKLPFPKKRRPKAKAAAKSKIA